MLSGHDPQWEPSASQVRAAHAKAVGGKRDKCNKGKSCSAACITRTDRCLVDIPLSPSQSTGRVRDFIQNKQSSDEGRAAVKFRREVEREVVRALASGDKDKYESSRQKVIDYNKSSTEKGLGNINVPVSWERAIKVKESYHKASKAIRVKVEEAARLGDKAAYDREERKLMNLQRRLGTRIGESKFIKRGEIWRREDGDDNVNNSFLKGLRGSSILKGAHIDRYQDDISISKMVSGYKVSLEIEENGKTFSFTINNSYEKPKGISNRIGMQIGSVTEEMFREVVRSMAEGSVVWVHPYGADGRGPKRRRAYERFGFGSVDDDSKMFGMVRGGVIAPANKDDMRDFDRNGEFNYKELSELERKRLFFTMLWGEDPAPSAIS